MRFFAPVQNGLGTHPASRTMRTWSFQGVKWRGVGADQPPPSSAEVTNVLKSYLRHPPCLRRHFMGWHLYWQKFTPVWLFTPLTITQTSLSIYLSHIAVDLSNNYKHEVPLRLKGKSPSPYSVPFLHFCYTLRSPLLPHPHPSKLYLCVPLQDWMKSLPSDGTVSNKELPPRVR